MNGYVYVGLAGLLFFLLGLVLGHWSVQTGLVKSATTIDFVMLTCLVLMPALYAGAALVITWGVPSGHH